MSEHFLRPTHSLGITVSNAVPSTIEQDEAQLVTASKQGDQDAFAQLVQQHQRRVFNLVFRMLQEYEEANEVTQETFLAAWQGLPSFRGDARFSTWLYRIAYNCALKQLEQRKRDQALQVDLRAEHVAANRDQEGRVDAELEAHARQTALPYRARRGAEPRPRLDRQRRVWLRPGDGPGGHPPAGSGSPGRAPALAVCLRPSHRRF